MAGASGHGWPPSVSPDLREMAERLLTPKQLEAYKLVARGYGMRRISLVLGITREAARDRVRSAELKMFNELDRLASAP